MAYIGLTCDYNEEFESILIIQRNLTQFEEELLEDIRIVLFLVLHLATIKKRFELFGRELCLTGIYLEDNVLELLEHFCHLEIIQTRVLEKVLNNVLIKQCFLDTLLDRAGPYHPVTFNCQSYSRKGYTV